MNLNKKKQLEFIFDSTGTKINSMKMKSCLSKGMLDFLFTKTSWMPTESTIPERVYVYLHDMNQKPLCRVCGINNTSFRNFLYGYKSTCSIQCASSYVERNEKRRKTNIERYGVEHVMHHDTFKEKIKKTNLGKYGVEYTFQSEDVKDKIRNTNIERYGVDNPAKSNIIYDRVKKTNLGKYGVEYTFQSEDVKERMKQTNLERYGVEYPSQSDEIKERVKETNIERFGVKNPMLLDSIKDKSKETCLRKYGVEYSLQSDIVREKSKETCLRKYGVENPNQSDIVREKSKETCLRKYGVENSLQKHNPLAFSLLKDKEWLNEQYKYNPGHAIAESIGVTQATVNRYIREYGFINYDFHLSSYIERDIVSFIKSIYPGKIETNVRGIIGRLELDIYIPEKKLAIELNGVYWHSTIYKDKSYHLNKTIECEKNGIQLLHIFDFEWDTKSEVWKSVIANKLGVTCNRIYARKCIIKEVSIQNGFRFFNENHLQGGLSKGTHIGLYVDQELVSCISYGASRFKKDEIELYRFANKLNTNVIGGFSKLLKRISGNVISYANRRWSTGNVYIKNGFELVDETPPNYFYYKNGKPYSRQMFQKHKLKEMNSYSDEKTEEQIMDEEGYLRIYDCGNLKYVYKGN